MRALGLRPALLLSGMIALPASFAVNPATASAGHSGLAASFEAGTPLILTRELRRVLAGGAAIVSRRSYRIAFVREGQGWRVDGAQVASEVEAPPQLAALAALEQARKDDGLFPLYLDENGLIVAQSGSSDQVAAGKAQTLVFGTIKQLALATAETNTAAEMTDKIVTQHRSVGGNWPADLFRPALARQPQVRDLGAVGSNPAGHANIFQYVRVYRRAAVKELKRF